MSATNTTEKENKTPVCKTFAYRNIKKEFTRFQSYETVTKEYHIELDSDNKTKIVQDRNNDWVEIANQDADKVGLAYVIDLAKKQGKDLRMFAFKDSEAMSTADLNPMDPESVAKLVNPSESKKKLESIAKQLGCTSDDLISAFVAGKLEDIISKKVEAVNTVAKKDGE